MSTFSGRILKNRALRLLQVHPLRAADALHLASALVATQEDPSKLPIMSFDERLTRAARKEGFMVNLLINRLTT
jgi:predicted nucleic acid-binding protein